MQAVNLYVGFAAGYVFVHKGDQFAHAFRVRHAGQNDNRVCPGIRDDFDVACRCLAPLTLLKDRGHGFYHFRGGGVYQVKIGYLIPGAFNVQRGNDFLQPSDVGQVIGNDQYARRWIGKHGTGFGYDRIQNPFYFIGVGPFQGNDLGDHPVFR